MSEALYYLQDSRNCVGNNVLWWGTDGGYTSDLSKAKVFTAEQAQRQHDTRETDIPWPKEYIDGKTRPAVDMQYIRHKEVSADTDSQLYYLQYGQSYIGNDVLWWAKDGGDYTTDLGKAGLFTKEEAQRRHDERDIDIPWPKDYIDAKARPAVDVRYIRLAEALAGTGIRLRKPRKPKGEPAFNCCGCGQFISERNRYTDCRHCGADNRP